MNHHRAVLDRPQASNLGSLTPDAVQRATREFRVIVDERLPERFWPGERAWRAVLTALVSRMAALLESLAALAVPARQPDALILLRALYEHLITFAWIAIDPIPRVDQYLQHSMIHKRALANDAAGFGLDDVLSEFEREVASDGQRFSPVDQRAQEVDEYWGPRIKGLYQDPADGPRHILTLRGLYVAIYRQASRQAHASIESPDECIVEDGRRHVVLREPKGDQIVWSAFAVPLFAIALVISHERLGWPDEARVREVNRAFVESSDADATE